MSGIDHNAGNGANPQSLAASVQPIRKAYEQVADQLRELIIGGELTAGSRLPIETELAREFGVSRPTVREALRVLAAQNLIRTTKGTAGGSFITAPTVDHISEFLRSSLGLLTEANGVSLEEFLEVREILEVRAARLAAERRTDADIERLRAAIPAHPMSLSIQDQFFFNRQFHSIVVDSCKNTLLYIAAQPVFSVLQTNLARSIIGKNVHRTINDQHSEIAEAIAAGDADAAGSLMHSHLEYLRPPYEKAWRHALKTTPETDPARD